MQAKIDSLNDFRGKEHAFTLLDPPLLFGNVLVDIRDFFEREIEGFEPLALFAEYCEISIILAADKEKTPNLRFFNYIRDITIPFGKTFFVKGINPATSGLRGKNGDWVVTFALIGEAVSKIYINKPRILVLRTTQNTTHVLRSINLR